MLHNAPVSVLLRLRLTMNYFKTSYSEIVSTMRELSHVLPNRDSAFMLFSKFSKFSLVTAERTRKKSQG